MCPREILTSVPKEYTQELPLNVVYSNKKLQMAHIKKLSITLEIISINKKMTKYFKSKKH